MKKLYIKKLGFLPMLLGSFLFSQNIKATLVEGDATEEDLNVTVAVYTVTGDLTVTESLEVSNGSTLVVKGNFTFTGQDAKNGKPNINIHGTLIVGGDLFFSSGALIKNNGNLIVGGNFTQESGAINLNGNESDLKIYILNPHAIVDVPPGSVVDNPDLVGDVENFLIDEGNSAIGDIVEDVIFSVSPVIGYQWKTDNDDGSWQIVDNWAGNKKPTYSNNARIKAPFEGKSHPVITSADGLIEVKNLIIEEGAVLTLKPGAKLTVYGTLTIEKEGGLVMENTTEEDGLASLITKGDVIGKARISVEFPRDKWYYVSQPIKEAKSDIYALLDEDDKFRTAEAWVNIHRANRWYRIAAGVGIAQLEGLSVKYKLTEEDADHVVAYSGDLNNGPISRDFTNNQYYLFGNPYPSAINWQAENGWIRNNISGTIYYRARVNGVMTFVTYNRSVDNEFARASVFPDGVDYGNVAELGSIPPLQSVWISSLGGGSITIDNDARQHVAAGSLLKSSSGGGNSSVIRVGVSSESGADGAVLYFSDNSEEGLDLGDSDKMFNDAEGIPEVFTRIGERALAINGLPIIQESSRIIPISVRNRVLGEVVLSFNMSAYDGSHTPYLEDRETGAFINLLQDQAYTYTVRETGENHDRFSLHLYKVSTDLVEPKEDEVDAGKAISIKSISGKVLISVGVDMLQGGQGIVEIYTIEGRKISEVPAKSSRTLVFLPSQSGIYIIRAQFGNKVKSERVIVNGN